MLKDLTDDQLVDLLVKNFTKQVNSELIAKYIEDYDLRMRKNVKYRTILNNLEIAYGTCIKRGIFHKFLDKIFATEYFEKTAHEFFHLFWVSPNFLDIVFYPIKENALSYFIVDGTARNIRKWIAEGKHQIILSYIVAILFDLNHKRIFYLQKGISAIYLFPSFHLEPEHAELISMCIEHSIMYILKKKKYNMSNYLISYISIKSVHIDEKGTIIIQLHTEKRKVGYLNELADFCLHLERLSQINEMMKLIDFSEHTEKLTILADDLMLKKNAKKAIKDLRRTL